MADVFLSYKRDDARRVRQLVTALREAGLDTWWDEDIPPSAPWEATIEKELASAKAVIVCWSPSAVTSENVRSEARVAREDGRLIQLFLKPCNPPLFFGERQGIDFANWRGKPDDERISKLAASVRGVAAGNRAFGDDQAGLRSRVSRRSLAAIAGLVLLLIAGVSAWWLHAASKNEGPQTLAVLPFRAINAQDANLVDAIWDDTRGALSRNPNLRVLGRQTLEALAKQDLSPSDYRNRVGADYLLDGSVQHVGDEVRMKFNLTRTKDGAEVWSDEVGGKLDNVFVFQERVANEVEGRIRGRIAPGGGTRAQNIATTGEVYSIYADALAKMRNRDSAGFLAAIPLLKKAVAIDPNYAPAWSRLGQATAMGLSRTPDKSPAVMQREGVSYIKRALQLAPNLAHAHAALAMIQNFPPELDGELRRAVELDPNDAEAWGWLANSLQAQNRLHEALAARNRAAEIDPLWYWTAANKIGTLGQLKDWKGIDEEIARVQKLGDPILLAKARFNAASASNHPGDEIRLLLDLRSRYPDQSSWVDNRIYAPLMQLGFTEEAMLAWHLPLYVAKNYRGIPDSAEVIKRDWPRPLDLWTDGDEAIALYGRLLPKQGRFREYIGYYDAAFKSPEDLISLWALTPGHFVGTAPTLAANLRAAARGE
ncbi:MAG TPA: TIR domain-containing protein, partial [Sphingomicrobium sp.]|nr:TIR domain-containing protein [Sphingomicrobium sp.]